MRWFALAAVALAGCTCSDEKPRTASADVPTVTHETLDKLAKCQKIEKAFPVAPKAPGETEEAVMLRTMQEVAARSGDVASACGFESGPQYAAFSFRAAVARAEMGDEPSVKRNDAPAAAQERAALERRWLADVDAGAMTAEELKTKREALAGVEKTLAGMRARLARRATLKTLDADVMTEVLGEGPGADRIRAMAEKQPPLSNEERRAVETWKP